VENKEYFLSQLNKVIEEYASLQTKSRHDDFSDCEEDIHSLITKTKATVQRIAGNNSEYYKELERILDKSGYEGEKLRYLIGTIFALKDDLESDFLKNIGEIIHSEIFTDFMDMAEYLLSEGYKDAAAVIAGTVLETHLRKLCTKNEISTKIQTTNDKVVPKKADTMNSELAAGSLYNTGVQKQVTAWLDIRNNAAHGNYSEYNESDVDLMIKGINHMVVVLPA